MLSRHPPEGVGGTQINLLVLQPASPEVLKNQNKPTNRVSRKPNITLLEFPHALNSSPEYFQQIITL
jgi:hypothetical protein